MNERDEELDRLFDKADSWTSTFNLSALGAYVLNHPQTIGREETARQKADREYHERTSIKHVE
jgi:hypothetical protein